MSNCCNDCDHWDIIESIQIEQWKLNKSGENDMPNKQAKARKRKRLLKNKELNRTGRTAVQVKRYKKKQEEKNKNNPVIGWAR
jgi:hypothetical protein|tara:strand:+ start:775 stop:1023 length:249 start_codon:yes stop_codon:yes gene_type:complete